MTQIRMPEGMEVTQQDVGRIASMVRIAATRGHEIRELYENEPVAPGVFAVCVECAATLRWYQGRPQGEAYYTHCPEAPTSTNTNTASLDDVAREARYAMYKTATPEVWASIFDTWAEGKGWNEQLTPDSFGNLIALMHSELSEALEEWRDGHALTEIYYVADKDGRPKPEGVPIELADCIIRILHTMAFYGMPITDALAIKHEYNITRPYRHGGKRT